VSWLARSSSIRPSCGPINTPRVHEKKRWTRSPGSWPLSGRIFYHMPCRLHRCTHGGLPDPHQWGAAGCPGLRAGVARPTGPPRAGRRRHGQGL
jgi:hypothetical protein